MTLSELGSVGEFIGAFGVIGSLIYVGFQIRQNTVATERTNVRLTAADHSRVLQSLCDRELSDILLRGVQDLSALTPHERYRFDLAVAAWLETIEQAFVDYLKGNFPKETIDVYRNRIPSLLSTPGGRTWWANRKVWFGQGFREEVDGLLASPPSASLKASVTREPGEAGPQ